MTYDTILILDFGSQYSQLIARSIREMGVYSELRPFNASLEDIKKISGLKGIILSGGPKSIYDEDAFLADSKILDLGVPILGICYGMQWMCHVLGGEVLPALNREYGRKTLKTLIKDPLFLDTPEKQSVWMNHGDKVTHIPEGFSIIAATNTCENTIIVHQDKRLYGIQFHPEVKHTEYGKTLFFNFVVSICGAKQDWSMASAIELAVKEIQATVKEGSVLCGLSGGVDSSVTALLLHKAIGDRLHCMFIDHGLLRKEEGDDVMRVFKDHFQINITRIDAEKRFLDKLKGVTDPEQKRKIIGNEFIYVFDEESKKLGDFAFLGQGTLYTDIIESGTAVAHTIKSHHNVGGIPKDMRFKLVEPLKHLFKDEVRALGKLLGLDEEIAYRQPFPGPGLAIRILGEVTKEKCDFLRESDAILRSEFTKAGLDKTVWQYFTVLPNISSVGVMGDKRTYQHAIIIRAVTSVDGMTADWARIPYEILDKVSRKIVNDIPEVNRVLYDITSKPPATIEYE